MITLKNIQTEKYGRILADVYIGDLHLNQHMIEKNIYKKETLKLHGLNAAGKNPFPQIK